MNRMHRFLVWLLLLLVPALAGVQAATVEDRAPFRSGHWWDSTRNGSGFEIFASGNQISAIWFTYASDGRPVWYYAQADRGSGPSHELPLYSSRWVDGAYGGHELVGSLRLNVKNPESVEARWRLGASEGLLNLRPLLFSGVIPEIDHTGLWFDPQRSGYGLTVNEQGDQLVAALYYYDAEGRPSWLFGHRAAGVSEFLMYTTSGSCPSCTYRPSTSRAVARAELVLGDEVNLRLNLVSTDAAVVPPNWAFAAQPLTLITTAASARSADRTLAPFAAPDNLLQEIRLGLIYNPVYTGGVDFSPPPASPAAASVSTTNVQETGVDEHDAVKADVNYVYAFSSTPTGIVQPSVRIARIDQGGAALSMRQSLPLTWNSTSGSLGLGGLYLTPDKLVTLTGTRPIYNWGWLWSYSYHWVNGRTVVEIFDRSNPEAPRSLWRAELDGHLVASRRIGSMLYLVQRQGLVLPNGTANATTPAAIERNTTLAAAFGLDQLLPDIRVNGGAAQNMVSAAQVYLPPSINRLRTPEFVIVTRINLQSPEDRQSIAILGQVQTVYVAQDNLYIASNKGELVYTSPAVPANVGQLQTTDIHRFDISNGRLALIDSGAAEGYLDSNLDRASFRFGELAGRLNVVTVSSNLWGVSKNRLTVLQPSTLTLGLLRTVAYLPNSRRPEPLGKPFEMLYATRYLGDRLYAVTFKKTDPLYVVDLSAAADPRIVGSLEIPGYSDYLHPLPNNMLLGFGKDSVPALSGWGDGLFAWFQGPMLTLFDVSDPLRPREVQRVVLGKRGGGSALLTHHHAYSELPRGTAQIEMAVPVRVHEATGYEPPNPSPNYNYPWSHSGLSRFLYDATGPAPPQLQALPPLITHRVGGPAPTYDAAMTTARSVLYQRGVVYVANGQLWHLPEGAVQPTGPH